MGIEAEYSVYSLLFLQRGRFCEVVFMTEGKPYISVMLDSSPQIFEYGGDTNAAYKSLLQYLQNGLN